MSSGSQGHEPPDPPLRLVSTTALAFGAALAVYACTEGTGPVGPRGEAGIRIEPRFALVGNAVSPIDRIVLTARTFPGETIVAVDTFRVDPDANEWSLPFEIPENAGRVTVLIVGIDATGAPQWSGVSAPIEVRLGRSPQPAPVTLFLGPPEALSVTALTVTPRTSSVTEGASVPLAAAITGGGPGVRAVWLSLDPGVASVGDDGVVSTLRSGVARIVAAAGPRADTATITVAQRASSLVIAPDTQRVSSLGFEVTYSARVLDPRGVEIVGAPVDWATENASVAALIAPGRFRSVANGTAPIVASSAAVPAVRGTATLIVVQRPVRVAITPATATATALGATQAFGVQVQDENGTVMPLPVVWRSSNPLVATVDASGTARAVAGGVVDLAAVAGAGTPDSLVGHATFTVAQVAATVVVTPDTAGVATVGGTVQYAASVRDANGNPFPAAPVAWSSSDERVATVSATGLATATGPGRAVVTARSGNATGAAIFGVANAALPNLTLRTDLVPLDTIVEGDSAVITVTVKNVGAGGAGASVTRLRIGEYNGPFDPAGDTLFATPALAAGDSVKFYIRGVPDELPDSVGVLVTADANEQVAESDEADNTPPTVKRYVRHQVASFVVVARTPLTALGDTMRVAATPKDWSGRTLSGRIVTFASSAPSVATVGAGGLVTAIANGTARIYVSSEHRTDSLAVVVQQLPTTFHIGPTPARDTLRLNAIGDTLLAVVVARDAHGNLIPGYRGALSSQDPAVVGVDTLDRVVSVDVGVTSVVATATVTPPLPASPYTLADTAIVVVQQVVATLDIAAATITLAANDTIRVSATALDSNGVVAHPSIAWISQDTAIATVDGTGFVRGVATINAGTYVVAAAGPLRDSVLVEVQGSPSGVTRLWRGVNSSLWSDTSNWFPRGTPTAADTVRFPAGVANDARLSDDQVIGGLLIDPGATLDIVARTLTVSGKVYADGTIASASGRLVLPGAGPVRAAQPLPGITFGGVRSLGSRIHSTGGVTSSGTLSLAGHTLQTDSSFAATGGAFTMTSPLDSLIAAANVSFDCGNTAGTLSEGVIALKGDLYVGACTYEAYAPSGAHTLVLNGTLAQSVFVNYADTTADRQHFQNVVFDNPAGVTLSTDLSINGDVTFTEPAGPLSGPGRTVKLLGDLGDATGARWLIGTTILGRSGIDLPPALTTDLVFTKSQSLAAPLTVNGSFSIVNGIELVEAGRKLTVNGSFATNGGGILNMTDAADSLIVNGDVTFACGNTVGKLTAGTIIAQRDFTVDACSFEAFAPSGTHTVILRDTLAQSVFVNYADTTADRQHFQNVVFDNPAGITLGTDLAINGTASWGETGGPVVGAGRTVTLLGDLLDGSGARWLVGTTRLGRPLQLPSAVVGSVVFLKSQSLLSPLQIAGDLTIDAAELTQAGKLVAVTGNMTGAHGGILKMTDPGDTLLVTGNLTYDCGNTSGKLTAGLILLQGDFSVSSCSYEAYAPSGDHTLMMIGTGPQTIFTNYPDTTADRQHFQNLQILNPTTVTLNSDIAVNGTLTVGGGVVVGTGRTVTILGGLQTEKESWQVPTTRVGRRGAELPFALATNLVYLVSDTLRSSLDLTGDFTLTGVDLTLENTQLSVTGNFATNDGRLVMTHDEDGVMVSGSALFHGGNTAGTLTAGVLHVAGDFTVDGGSYEAFAPSGSHKVVLNGHAQTVSLSYPGAAADRQHFQWLYIESDSVRFASDVDVNGVLTVPYLEAPPGRIVAASGHALRLRGIDAQRVVFDHAILTVAGDSLFTMDGLVFRNYPSTATQVTITSGSEIGASDWTFLSTPSSGLFINALAGVNLYVNGFSPTYHAGRISGSVIGWSLAPDGITRTWMGGSSGSWATASNWSPAIVPDGTDAVWIPWGRPHDATLAAGATVRKIVVDSGAVVSVGAQDLTVIQEAFGPGTVSATTGHVVLADAGQWSYFGGAINLPSLLVQGSWAGTGGGGTIDGDVVIGSSGNLSPGGFRVRVNGDLDDSGTGFVTMTNASDTLDVRGDVTFGQPNGAVGAMSAGTLLVGGSFTTQYSGGYNTAFRATGTHRVVMNGAAPQTISFAWTDGSHYFNQLELDNPDGVVFASDLVVDDSVRVTSGTAVGNVTVRVGNGLVDVAGGRWRPTWTQIYGAAPYVPNPIASNVIFASASTLATNLTTSDSVYVNNGADVHLGGHTLRVGGDFTQDGVGYFDMTNALDSLIVGKDVFFSRTNGTPSPFSAGVIRVRGDFTTGYAGGYNTAFRATGAHKVVMDGTGAQTISFAWTDGSHYFNRLELANPDSVIFATNAWVTDQASMTTGKAVGSVLVHVGNAIATPSDAWRVATTRLYNTGATVTNRLRTNLVFDTNVQLGSSVATTGNVDLNGGSLRLGGHALVVGGSFTDGNIGLLEMVDPADSLDVAGDVDLAQPNGAVAVDSAGVMRVGGNFTTRYSGGYNTAFRAIGSHRVVFTGATEAVVSLEWGDGSHYFNDLSVVGTGGIRLGTSYVPAGRDVLVGAGSHILIPASTTLDVFRNLVVNGSIQNGGTLIANPARITNPGNISGNAVTPGH